VPVNRKEKLSNKSEKIRNNINGAARPSNVFYTNSQKEMDL